MKSSALTKEAKRQAKDKVFAETGAEYYSFEVTRVSVGGVNVEVQTDPDGEMFHGIGFQVSGHDLQPTGSGDGSVLFEGSLDAVRNLSTAMKVAADIVEERHTLPRGRQLRSA